jgi:hypothetical protein
MAHANPAAAPTSAPRRDGDAALLTSTDRRVISSAVAVVSVERGDAFSSFARALEVPARASPEVSPSRETPRLSRASAHVLALVVRPLDRAIDALPHGRAVETTSLGAGAVAAGKGMLHLARGRGDEHGIRGRTDGAEDTENQHSNRQFAARHAPDALLRDAEETIAKSDSRASLANRVSDAASEKMREVAEHLVVDIAKHSTEPRWNSSVDCDVLPIKLIGS